MGSSIETVSCCVVNTSVSGGQSINKVCVCFGSCVNQFLIWFSVFKKKIKSLFPANEVFLKTYTCQQLAMIGLMVRFIIKLYLIYSVVQVTDTYMQHWLFLIYNAIICKHQINLLHFFYRFKPKLLLKKTDFVIDIKDWI